MPNQAYEERFHLCANRLSAPEGWFSCQLDLAHEGPHRERGIDSGGLEEPDKKWVVEWIDVPKSS